MARTRPDDKIHSLGRIIIKFRPAIQGASTQCGCTRRVFRGWILKVHATLKGEREKGRREEKKRAK